VAKEWPRQSSPEQGAAFFSAVPVAHENLKAFEVHVLNPQAAALHQARSGAVEQCGHKAWSAPQPVEEIPDFGAGQRD
jgi:hypothetical protein